MIRVYTASKLRHGPMWRDLCSKRSDVIFHARWLKHNAIGTPDTPGNAASFWMQDQDDIISAEALIIYAEPEDKLRGALVEAGIAIAHGKVVVVVGEHPDYGTWQYHPNCQRVPDLNAAFALLNGIFVCP